MSIADAKKYLAHSYLTIKVDTSLIHNTYPQVPFEHFVRLAIQKAYKKTISKNELVINQMGAPDAVSLSQVKDAVEVFPVALGDFQLAVHYTHPATEVVLSSGSQTFDIASEEAKDSERTLNWSELKSI